MMGDKPMRAQRVINFLNSQSKMQLQFAGIQDRVYLIMQAKKYIVKESLAKEVLVKEKFLKARADQFKQALWDTKSLLWDHMFKEIKNLKDYLLMLQDDKALVDTCLSNVNLVQEMMGDKPVQAQRAINFLNSQSKTQLQFSGIQDKAKLIVHAKKYIVNETLAKEVLMKANFLKARVNQFKHAFKCLFDNGLPSFWNEEGIIISEDDYLSFRNEKKNDTSRIDKLDPIIKGSHIYDVLDKDVYLYYEARIIISNLPPPSYNLFSDLDVVNKDLLAVAFPASSVWQRIAQFSSKWNFSES